MPLNLGDVNFNVGANTSGLNKAKKDLNQFGKESKRAGDRVKKTTQSTGGLSDKMTDLSKSVQVALGPLSGVAARLTAITALANRNTAAIAGVIGGLIAFAAAAGKVIKTGLEVEKQLFQIEGRLKATGGAVGLTTKQLDEMAISLGKNTLTSASEARKAILTLMTATNLTGKEFERALKIAQDFAALGFGNLQRSAQQLARIFEDPIANLELLRRKNITFDVVEKRRITTLINLGKRQEANLLILSKFATFLGAAEEEAKGLAGAFDTMAETTTNFLAEVALTSGSLQGLGDEIREITAAFDAQIKQTGAVQRFGAAVRGVVVGLAKALVFVVTHFDKIVVIIGGFIAGRLLATLVFGFVSAAVGIFKMVLALTALKGALLATRAVLISTAILGLRRFIAIAVLLAAVILVMTDNLELIGIVIGKVVKAVGEVDKKLGAGLKEGPEAIAEITEAIRKAAFNFAIISGEAALATGEVDRFSKTATGLGGLDERVVRLAERLGVLGTTLKIVSTGGRKFVIDFVGPAGEQLRTLNRILTRTEGFKRLTQLVKETRTPIEVLIDQLVELSELRAFAILHVDAERLPVALEAISRKTEQLKKEFDEVGNAGLLMAEAAIDFTSTIAQGFEDAIIEGQGLREVLLGLENDLIRIGLRATLLKPIEEGLTAAFEGRQAAFGGDLAEMVRKGVLSLGLGKEAVAGEEPSDIQKQFVDALVEMNTNVNVLSKNIGTNLTDAVTKQVSETAVLSASNTAASTALQGFTGDVLAAAAALRTIGGGPEGLDILGLVPGIGPSATPLADVAAATGIISPFQRGGAFRAGQPILVGEGGPEVLVPPRAGTVIPSEEISGPSISVSMTINTPDANSFRQSQGQIIADLTRLLQRGARNR